MTLESGTLVPEPKFLTWSANAAETNGGGQVRKKRFDGNWMGEWGDVPDTTGYDWMKRPCEVRQGARLQRGEKKN